MEHPIAPKPDTVALKPEIALPNPTWQPVRFDDRPLMAVGIPAFGLSIPFLTRLLRFDDPAFAIGDAAWWASLAWFVGLAFCIWWGNRWLLFKQREHLDWFAQPLRKLVMLVAACSLYTAPLTVAWLAGWYGALGQAPDWPTIRVVALINVICVIFVTHAYETLFLIRERESDALHLAQLERSRSEAELAALKSQIDPHFLFNSLNTLGHLVTHDAARAREFCDHLAETYRYVLGAGRRQRVPLADELDFVRQYTRLLALRFGEPAVVVQLPDPLPLSRTIVPLALQVLLENAVKHNALAADMPLHITLELDGDWLWVRNPRRPRAGHVPSAGVGLANLDERCKLEAGRGLLRDDQRPGEFAVAVPLLGGALSA